MKPIKIGMYRILDILTVSMRAVVIVPLFRASLSTVGAGACNTETLHTKCPTQLLQNHKVIFGVDVVLRSVAATVAIYTITTTQIDWG